MSCFASHKIRFSITQLSDYPFTKSANLSFPLWQFSASLRLRVEIRFSITKLPIYQIAQAASLSPQRGVIIEPRPSGLGTETKRNLPLCRRPSRSAKRGATWKDRPQWSAQSPLSSPAAVIPALAQTSAIDPHLAQGCTASRADYVMSRLIATCIFLDIAPMFIK